MKKTKMLASLMMIFFFNFGAYAEGVDLTTTRPLNLPVNMSDQQFWATTAPKIFPSKLEATDTGLSVVTKMVDNSFSYWWNSEVKNTSVGQMADRVEKKLNAEVSLGNSGPQKTQHKLSFKILAMQALAKLEYRGWMKAALNYNAKNSTTEAEVTESLTPNNDFVMSHTITSFENKSQLSLRWNW